MFAREGRALRAPRSFAAKAATVICCSAKHAA